MQPQPAVAAKHRDAFGKIVERFALNADQFLKTPLEIEPLGDVVEQVGDPAVRIGGGDDAQSASVGQMPGMFLGFDGAIGLVQLRLPLAKILLLRQLARRAQDLDHRRIGRALIEEAGIEIPQRAIGGIVERQPMIGVEHGDAGRKADRACGDARRRGARARRAWFPLPWRPCRCRRCRSRYENRARRRSAARRRRRREAGRHRSRRCRRACAMFSRAALSSSSKRRSMASAGLLASTARAYAALTKVRSPRRIARPYRRRQFFGERAQRAEFGRLPLVTGEELHKLALDAAGILKAQHGAAADGAALRLDRLTRERGERHRERLAARAQGVDRMFHRAALPASSQLPNASTRRAAAATPKAAGSPSMVGSSEPASQSTTT